MCTHTYMYIFSRYTHHTHRGAPVKSLLNCLFGDPFAMAELGDRLNVAGYLLPFFAMSKLTSNHVNVKKFIHSIAKEMNMSLQAEHTLQALFKASRFNIEGLMHLSKDVFERTVMRILYQLTNVTSLAGAANLLATREQLCKVIKLLVAFDTKRFNLKDGTALKKWASAMSAIVTGKAPELFQGMHIRVYVYVWRICIIVHVHVSHYAVHYTTHAQRAPRSPNSPSSTKS
jgi:hypothetical protein